MKSRSLILAAVVAAPCLGAVPATRPASPATKPISAFDAQRLVDEQQAARQVVDYTLAAPAAVNRAVALSVDHGQLTLRTCVAPTLGFERINFSDLPGLSVLNIRQMRNALPSKAGNDALYTPDFFMLTHYDFSNPDWAESLLTAAITPMNLQLADDAESPTRTQNISLIQDTGMFNTGEPAVRLRVAISDTGHDKPLVNLERTAPDFVTLRRTYPDDCARYVEPMLHALHADADVLSPDPKLVWQVLADDIPVNPTMAKRVGQIIKRFNADSYRDRQTASAELAALGEPAALALRQFNRSNLSPEQISQVNSFLAPYEPVSDAEAKRLGHNMDFLLDCLYDRDRAVVGKALDRLRAITHQQFIFDVTAAPNARRDAITKLRRKLVPKP